MTTIKPASISCVVNFEIDGNTSPTTDLIKESRLMNLEFNKNATQNLIKPQKKKKN